MHAYSRSQFEYLTLLEAPELSLVAVERNLVMRNGLMATELSTSIGWPRNGLVGSEGNVPGPTGHCGTTLYY